MTRRCTPPSWRMSWRVVVGLLAVTACTSEPAGSDGDPGADAHVADGDHELAALDAGDVAVAAESDLADTGIDAREITSPPDTLVGPEASIEAGPTDVITPVAPTGDFGRDELVMRITEPSGRSSATVEGQLVQLGGVLIGAADTLGWSASSGDAGAILPQRYWRSGPIALAPGDNHITVTARRDGQVATDSVMVTYNPAFRFDGPPAAKPELAWVGEPTQVVVSVAMSQYAGFDPTSLELFRADADGQMVDVLGPMRDDGASTSSSADEIQGDGVFSRRLTLTCASPEPILLRARVDIDNGAGLYTALSSVVEVECVQRFSPAQCAAHTKVIGDAEAQAAAGRSAEEVASWLLEHPDVVEAGVASLQGESVWMRFSTGVLGAVLLTAPGLRGSGGGSRDWAPTRTTFLVGGVNAIGSRRAAVFAPFFQEFGATDDGPLVASAIAASRCPTYDLEGNAALTGAQASLERFRRLDQFGLVSLSTHGEALFETMDDVLKADRYGWEHLGAQEVVWSGEPVQCAQLTSGAQTCVVKADSPTGGCPVGTVCVTIDGSGGSSSSGLCLDRTQADLRQGRLVLTNRGYAMTPAFFDAYAGRGLPNSLINLGACRTMFNGNLAVTLLAHGAAGVTGFSGYVQSAWARERVLELIEPAIGQGTVGAAMKAAEDPNQPGTWWMHLGASTLTLAQSEIVNAGFERGDTTGWNRDGDGRVVSKLGAVTPREGKFMSVLSTGLGFTVSTGTLDQSFCVPADKTSIELSWKFYSEEFREFCGSPFQDTFQAVLVGEVGTITLVDIKVDDLCGYTDGDCGPCPAPNSCSFDCMGTPACAVDTVTQQCSGAYNCQCGKYFVGLSESDVGFDKGEVFHTHWQRTVRDVSALAGSGPVTLRLFATDQGDSIYDTAILVDDIRFK